MAHKFWESNMPEERMSLSLEEYNQLQDYRALRTSLTKRGKRICVDFDGVIHAYRDGWNGGVIYDVVVHGALETMDKLEKAGFEVVVFTTRGATQATEVSTWIDEQQTALGLPYRHYDVTATKPPAIAYIDDRAVRFTNWLDIGKLFM